MINVTIPEDLDILYYYEKGTTKMALKMGDELFGPVPGKGSFGPLSDMMVKSRPETFNKEQATTVLMILHFSFLDKGKNRSGIEYPTKNMKGCDHGTLQR